MFTGIIEKNGIVKSISKNTKSTILDIAVDDILNEVKLGDSIAINGVCLTITNFNSNSFCADVMNETIKVTSLNKLNFGDNVNVERAMAANGRFDGHIVAGHVDQVSKIKNIKQISNSFLIELEIDQKNKLYVVEKGSITIDGISLTIAKLNENMVTVSIIPHTYTNTNLSNKKIGDIVNIEFDALGKYVAKQINKEKSVIDKSFLSENGFI
ncbi:MAG: riboflavin synthase [Spiroplasma sp.]|nr:riboflavin synthase [Mycoplasmatales bacterium]